MEKMPYLYCNTVDELIQCSKLPLHAYPTVEFAVRNVELPLDNDDYQWLSSNEINLFGVDSYSTSRPKVARGKNTTGPTFTVDTPIVVTGLCVFAYGEPYSTVVEGNKFGPVSVMDTYGATPASPINLRAQAGARAALYNGGAPEGVANPCAAQLDWGGPTWRFIWAFLNAYRLRFDCPNSAYETIINERLVDIGNCCSMVDFSGLSDAKTPHSFITRRMNQRFKTFTSPTMDPTYDAAGVIGDPGYFVPINCEQNADFEITPNRMVADSAAYGRPAALPAIESWYRLPFPMPLDTNTKIKLIMDKAEGDEDYEQRMYDEGTMRQCVGPIPGNASTFPINETDHDADGTGGDAAFTNIPGGMMRLGLGLKGFQVREGVCHQWKRTLQDKSLMSQLMSGQAYQGFSGTGLCGAPGEDVGEKIIDEALSGGGIEQVNSDGGYVGE